MAFGIHHLGSLISPLRQAHQEANHDAAPMAEPASPEYGLAHNNQAVMSAYEAVLQCARRCTDSEPQYSLTALNDLHQVVKRYVDAFQRASTNVQNREAVSGDLMAALEDAKARLQVRPSHHASSLRALLHNLLERLERYSNRGAAPTLNDFPALHAGLDAYLRSLGAQPLHVSNGLARIRLAARPGIRTPQDIHRQALQIVRPQAAPDHADGAAEVSVPAERADIPNPEPLPFPPPDYGNQLNAIPGRCDLPPDLALRVARYLHKLNKEPGLTSFRGPSPSALLEELKALLGMENMIPTHRGEILMRLAEGIQQRPGRTGIPEAEQLARLFLRFLAPQALPAGFAQSPAALRAGVNTSGFNREALVPDTSKLLIMEAMITKVGHLPHAGNTACLILRTALDEMEKGTVVHANLLSTAAKAIQTTQSLRRNAVSFHHWFETIVDEVVALDAVASDHRAQVDREALRPFILDLEPIAYQLRGLAVQGAPGEWSGQLADMSAYQRLLNTVDYANRLPADDIPPPAYSQSNAASSLQ